jgi:hypothetical protein
MTTPPLRCLECRHRFGARARLYTFPGTQLALCQRCVLTRWPHLHGKYFFCTQRHDLAHHRPFLITRARFAQQVAN